LIAIFHQVLHATHFPIRFKLVVLWHPVSTCAVGGLSQNLTPCSVTMECNVACWPLICYSLSACTQTQRASPYCSSMITTKTSVLSLQTTMRSGNKGMLSEIVYMLADHRAPTINRQCYIPVNSIVAEHGAKFCENLPTSHVRTECHSICSSYRKGTCVANTKLQDLVGNGT
jgi:hypothetical protein